MSAARRVDPFRPWFVVQRLPDPAMTGVTQSPDGKGIVPADTRPPWQRG